MTPCCRRREHLVRDHRNGVRNRSETLSAFNRNSCPPSSEYAIYPVRVRHQREMAGAAQADRARHDASGSHSGSRHNRWDRPVQRNPGRGPWCRFRREARARERHRHCSGGYPAEPLVSYQINRQLSGWNLPPLVIRAFGAHCQRRTCVVFRNAPVGWNWLRRCDGLFAKSMSGVVASREFVEFQTGEILAV
jgi:hypothetical protein